MFDGEGRSSWDDFLLKWQCSSNLQAEFYPLMDEWRWASDSPANLVGFESCSRRYNLKGKFDYCGRSHIDSSYEEILKSRELESYPQICPYTTTRLWNDHCNIGHSLRNRNNITAPSNSNPDISYTKCLQVVNTVEHPNLQ